MQDHREVPPEVEESRRGIVKKMAYAVPIVLSMAASPSFATSGSKDKKDKGEGDQGENQQ